ncbi:hypothetical protein Sinac_6913 [Singulisphaera acidiphila DSM 18658]|uniref:Uncharacterized protein n=1 Tax=Singulisphaera acidiphila (strain ATCC BAA-1392 / DSM 18658 / VKM B-2454 / MOB10) TaxID=886293 RepID=L0DNM3_SINAD|nr:hypothetical protein Sinac_6913 [Singulisphaera acidiphila DSM 18658]
MSGNPSDTFSASGQSARSFSPSGGSPWRLALRLPSTLLNYLLVVAVIGLIVAAVRLGRADGGPRRSRLEAAPRCRVVSHQVLIDPTSHQYISLLNAETGEIERVSVGEPDTFAYSVCSPWRDGLNRMHLVAQWRGYDVNGCWTAGLARYALPGGEVLDRLPLEVPASGPPCWSPDLSATILFAGTDGRLYRHSFGHNGDSNRSRVDGLLPRPLTWKISPPLGVAILRVLDPTWPIEPSLERTLLVSMAVREDRADTSGPELPQLWWLRLSADGWAIEAAGRLVRPALERRGEPIQEERLARISATPDGGLALAYLVRRQGHTDLELRLAPVTVDEETGGLRVDESDVIELTDGLACSPPIFSEDGRWVYVTVKADLAEVQAEAPLRVHRFSVVDSLASPPLAVHPCSSLGFAPHEWEPECTEAVRGCEACGEAETSPRWSVGPAASQPSRECE